MAQNCQLPSTTQNPCERIRTPQNTPEFKESQRTAQNPWECLTMPQSTPEGHKEHHRFFRNLSEQPTTLEKVSECFKIPQNTPEEQKTLPQDTTEYDGTCQTLRSTTQNTWEPFKTHKNTLEQQKTPQNVQEPFRTTQIRWTHPRQL